MTRWNKITPFASLFLAGLVAMLTIGVVSRAIGAVVVPNETVVSYSLAAGASSGVITPPANVPVLIMGTNQVLADASVGTVTLMNLTGEGALTWVGIEDECNTILTHETTAGFGSTSGQHIVTIDCNGGTVPGGVELQVNNATSFKIHNGSTSTQSGKVAMIF